MKKKILFVADWPDSFQNAALLQKLLDDEYSQNYEWTVWSCKRNINSSKLYRWYCYTKGACYIILKRRKYHAVFIWQQMVAFALFEILKLFPYKVPKIVFFTFIYNSNTIFKFYKKSMVRNAFRHSQGLLWPSEEMSNEVKHDFPKFALKNHFALIPIFDVIDSSIAVSTALDDPFFRNGIFTAGKSERDFNIVIRAFNETTVPVTIVCEVDYIITETNYSSNIRVLRFSQVSHEQYYALAYHSFCIVISVINEKSPCGGLIICFAMSNAIPLIATDSSGARDFVVDDVNGLLFKVGDSDKLRQAYERLRSDERFKNRIIENAKQTVDEMSPGRYIEKIISIIEN